MSTSLSDYVTSVIRTAIPIGWGTVLAWLVSVNILDEAAADGPGVAAGGFLVTIAIGVYYALARFLETQEWFPRWAAGILLGAPAAPVYARPAERSTPPPEPWKADEPTPPTGSPTPFTDGIDRPREGRRRLD